MIIYLHDNSFYEELQICLSESCTIFMINGLHQKLRKYYIYKSKTGANTMQQKDLSYTVKLYRWFIEQRINLIKSAQDDQDVNIRSEIIAPQIDFVFCSIVVEICYYIATFRGTEHNSIMKLIAILV